MDALITTLNQRISGQVAEKNPAQDVVKPQQNFAELLDSKRSESMIDKIQETLLDGGKREIKVMSAENIEIERLDVDLEKGTNFDPKQKMSEMFSSLNDDIHKLDFTIEMLADPNSHKLSRTELLSCQFFVQKTNMMVEVTGKVVQSFSQTANTLMNMNVG